MSRLKDLIDKLVHVIVGYNEMQTGKEYDLDEINALAGGDLHRRLEALIQVATESHSTRGPLFYYYLHTIDKLHPLITKNTPLDPTEVEIVSSSICDLLRNTRRLLQMPQTNAPLSVKYGDKVVPMKGFQVSKYWGIDHCRTGQLVMCHLFKPLKLSEIAKSGDIETLVSKLIEKHQQPLILRQQQSQLSQLQEENEQLRRSLQTEQIKSEAMAARVDSALKEVAVQGTELEKKSAAIEDLIRKRGQLILEIGNLKEENSNLQSGLKSQRFFTPRLAALRVSSAFSGLTDDYHPSRLLTDSFHDSVDLNP